MSGGLVHPGWCDPRCCRVDGVGGGHCSEPVVLRARDALLVFAWVCADGEPPQLRVDVVHAGGAAQDTRVYFLAQEVHRVKERLDTEYHRARFLSAPVVAGPCAAGGAA